MRTDLSALQIVARILMRYPPIRRRADVPALLEEFSRTLWEELDYESEASNVERFAQIHAHDSRIYIPAVYREHSTRRVLVLENVETLKVGDIAAQINVGIDPKAVANVLLEAYFKQVFEEGFFHADPHPGNLFVRPRPIGRASRALGRFCSSLSILAWWATSPASWATIYARS